MSSLTALALHYQQPLESVSGSNSSAASDAAGRSLYAAMCRAGPGSGGGLADDWTAFEPLIQQTTLATTIVSSFERIPWSAVTSQMLCGNEDLHLPAMQINAAILNQLLCSALTSQAVVGRRFGSKSASPVALRMLRQVLITLLC